MFRRIISCCLLGIAFLPVFGQKAWTLEDCVNYAMEHSIDIKKQEYTIEREQLSLQEGKWAFVPRLSASTSYTMSTGRVLDPTTYDFVKTNYTGNNSSSVSGDVTLFEGGRKLFALSRAKLSLRAAMLQEESLRHNLRLQIIGAYMDVLCAREQVRIAEETMQVVEHQLERTKTVYEAGGITETDVLQLHAQLTSARKDVSLAHYSCSMAKLTLCDLLEWEDNENFEVADLQDMNLSLIGWDRESVVELHPEFRTSVLRKELADIDYKIAVTAISPRLSLSAGFGTSFSDARQKALFNEDGTVRYEVYPFFEQYADNGSAFVSVSLSIPILNGLSTKNGIKRARIAVAETELSVQETHKRLRKQLFQAEMDYYSARDRYHHSVEEADYAEEVFSQIERKYNLGVVDYLAWKTAAVELAKACYALAEAKYTYLLRGEILKSL